MSGESIMLVITKIEDPEELDTRFAKFSPPSDEDTESLSVSYTHLELLSRLLASS